MYKEKGFSVSKKRRHCELVRTLARNYHGQIHHDERKMHRTPPFVILSEPASRRIFALTICTADHKCEDPSTRSACSG